MEVSDRLDQIEASLAKISNYILNNIPTDDEIEAVRIEIFGAIKDLKESITVLENQTNLIEQRISDE